MKKNFIIFMMEGRGFISPLIEKNYFRIREVEKRKKRIIFGKEK